MPLVAWLKQRFAKKQANLSISTEPIFIHAAQTDAISRLQGRCNRLRDALLEDMPADRRQALTNELERKGAALRRALAK
jgi:hypothetical protein